MATGFTTVTSLGELYVRAHADMKARVIAAMIPDGGWESAPRDAGEAVKEAAAPQPPIEWTKYPPPRDPFAAKDKR